ncbi:MAG: hypothetical protein ACYS80_20745, partial [Planctomycetota bacterium]
MQLVSQNSKLLPMFVCILGICLVLLVRVNAEANAPEAALANMPVREVTVFKDGHAFVLHEGKMPTNTDGNVMLDYLPRPIIGTFWAYSADVKAK